MGKSSKKSASKVSTPPVVVTPASSKSLKKGKREAEEVEKEVRTKKPKVEGKKNGLKPKKVLKEESSSEQDTSTESEQETKVAAKKGNMDSEPKKSAVVVNDSHVASKKKAESSDDSESSSEDESNSDEEVAAVKKTPAPLVKKGPASAPAKEDESSDETDSSSKDGSSDEDVSATKKAPPAVSQKKSEMSGKKKDESSSEDSDSSEDESDSEEDATSAKKAHKPPANKSPVATTKKKENTSSDGESSDQDVPAKNYSKTVAKKDESSEESESDDSSSSEEDDKDVVMTDATPTKANAWNGFEKTPKTQPTPKEESTGSKTLFVGNLHFSVEQLDIENFFKPAGEIIDVRFGMNPDHTFRGFCHVEFATSEEAEKAVNELNGKELLGRPVRLDLARERGAYTPTSGDSQSFQKGSRDQGQTVFVRGFDRNDSEDQIRSSLEDHFGSCGEISRVAIPVDPEGGVKGIAYIKFKDSNAFNKALELNGSVFGEGTLTVEEAKPRGDFSSGGGGRGGSRDFGGRSGGRGRDFGGRSGGRGRDFTGRSGGRGGRFGGRGR